MKGALRMITVLAAVGIVSGASLVLVYRYARPRIEENEKRALQEAITEVMPGIAAYEELEEEGVYKGTDEEGNILGYAFLASGNGYQGEIRIMVGITPSFDTLTGIEILKSSETPGLGAEITRDPFKEQFRDLSAGTSIAYTKGTPSAHNEIQAITGATVSTRAVVTIINDRIAHLRKTIGDGI